MAKRGRPRALTLNPAAVDDRLRALSKSRRWLCEIAGITASQLSDALGHRRKGVSATVVEEMALALGCSPETIAPELLDRFFATRPGDIVAAS